jgi:hypothetical protein
MSQTTQRRIGLGGTVHLGSTAGASDVYNSADISEWSEEITVEVEDLRALTDFDAADAPIGRVRTGTIAKMICGSTTFVTALLGAPGGLVVWLELFMGNQPAATPSSADLVESGWAMLTGGSVKNPRSKVVEDLKFKFQGPPA